MTTGQRIAQKRKERNLSQEALGEAMGVSRQSISKWESDTTIPEIDKLVAMSRLFEVRVGWLLGVEEENSAQQENTDSGESSELNETQMKMVEEIVARYLAAQPKPVSRRRRKLFKIAIAVAAVCLCIGLYSLSSKLDNLDSRYNALQNSVNNVSSNVNSQIGNIADRVEEVLKSQNNLTADYGVEPVAMDLAANAVSFSAYAVPKTYTEGMTARFLAESGGELVEFEGRLREDMSFAAEMNVPLTDTVNISVVFLNGNVRETQLLDSFTGLLHQTIPEGYAEDVWQFDECSWEEKTGLHIPADVTYVRPQWEHGGSYIYGGLSVESADVEEIKVGIFKNRELVTWMTAIAQPSNYHGFDDCLFFAYDEQTIPFDDGDVLCLATVVTDEYGRTTVRGGMEWELMDADEAAERGQEERGLTENGENGYYRYDDPAEWGL